MNCPKCNHSISEGTHFCPQCGAAIVAAPEPLAREVSQGAAAQIEVNQQVGTVESGRVVGVDLGEVLGDVNIGNYTLRIGTLNGGVVNVAPSQQKSVPQPRPVPVMLLPRPFAGFLDRTEEVSSATAVLEGASPVEFHGPPGVGKTALLHYLAHYKFAPVFSAGVVFFSEIRHRPVDDLLLDFFDAFYERDPTYLPTPVQMRHALRDEHALVVLDDVDLEMEEVVALMDAAPASVFLSAATERRLWSGGRTIALRGLPSEDALALIERELGYPLGEKDRTIVQQLYASLEGYPLRLLQLGALVRDEGISLAEVAERLQQHAGSVGEAVTEQVLATRSEDEQRVLAALAVPMGASVGEEHLNELAGVADARPALESLQQRKLVQAHSPRYSLTGSLDETLREEWDLTPWNERALVHFATWAEEQRHASDRVLEEADSILGVLQRSAQNGHWEGVLRLGQATEGPLAVRGHWGAWAETLKWELEAARQLGDRAAEAWSLHQSGTRALCLEDAPTARRDLSEALRLRESLGDREGAAVTRHNLNLLGGFGGNDGLQGNGSGGGAGSRALWPLIVGTIVVVAILALIAAALGEEIWPTSPGNESPPGRDQRGGGGGDQRGGGGGDQTGGGGGDQTGGGVGTTGVDTTQGGTTGVGTTGLDTTGVGTTRGGTGTTTGESNFPYETSYKGA
jgi:zinc-ribbon domain